MSADGRHHLTRRRFLLAGAAAVAGAGALWHEMLRGRWREGLPGSIVGASAAVGHRLRDKVVTTPAAINESETVIVGGGIAGLSAAWWLKRHGYERFTLLELEAEPGGNARSGVNGITAFPWGAHYVPLPGPDADLVKVLFEELGVIRGYDDHRRPVYDELYLCADPHERLFIRGRWQEGLVPALGLTTDEQRQIEEFFATVESLRKRVGRDGKRAFAIPMDRSSRDADLLALDRVSMESHMRERGWTAAPLHWYVRYCCRDDYGVGHDQVSAWAGFHYFASRGGEAANAESQAVVTWPAGNGWVVERLRAMCGENIRTGTLVESIENTEDGAVVDARDSVTGKVVRWRAQRVIFAAPRFVAARVIKPHRGEAVAVAREARYAPWLVANVTLNALPKGLGAPLSWDNVSYHSESLGYVVATHQDLKAFLRETVVTWYQPLDHVDPVTARKQAIETTHATWAERVAVDLERMHPGIRQTITNIDVCVWGHGMISPPVGFLWGGERDKLAAPFGHIHFAHSDMSGLSLFEEAQFRGVRAAEEVLAKVGRG